MPRNDQRHSLNVLRSLRAAGHDEPALMQAALLHDVAKSTGGVTLFHRVAVVLLKIVRPDWARSHGADPAARPRRACVTPSGHTPTTRNWARRWPRRPAAIRWL